MKCGPHVSFNSWTGKVFLVCMLFFLDKPTFSAIVVQPLVITQDTTWKSDTIKISSNLVVNEKATLTIIPGVVVEFQGAYSITVYGALNALGTSTDSIQFISSKKGVGIKWRGIHFLKSKKASALNYCVLSNSEAEQGGAIYASNGFSLEINHCSFSNNSATRGGAMYIENTTVSISNSRIFSCVSKAPGGGIFLSSCNKATLSGNYIYNNKANQFGGGIYSESSKSLIQYNRILNNICVDDAMGMWGGGGMALLFGSESVLNNVISNNETNSVGGGIIFVSGNGHFVNNTICNNKAMQGGGMAVVDSEIDVYNSIVWKNQSVEVSPVKSHNLYINSTKSSRFRNCLTRTGADYLLDNSKSSVFTNNIELDPLFLQPFGQIGNAADAMHASWLPGANSPCLDAGYKQTDITDYDIEGKYRVVGANVDIGAYEFQEELVVSGAINADAIWYGKIKITGDIIIGYNAKLFITAGTEISFAGAHQILANGQIIANGQPQKPILFSRDVVRKNLYPLSSDDGWCGLRFNANEKGLSSLLDFCILEYCKNTSENEIIGGAITCNEASKLTIRNSIIRYSASDKGGAIAALKDAEVSIVNSLFYGNFANAGGAFNMQQAVLRVLNCTLYDNSAQEGAVLYCFNTSPWLENSIFWKNIARGGEQIYLSDENSDPNIIYSVVEGGPKGIGGPGSEDQFSGAFRNNMDKNPLFNSPNKDNRFTLKPQSPCINAGNPGTTETDAGLTDLMGDSRFRQAAIDIGAYEYQDILMKKPIPDLTLTANSDTYTVDLSAYFARTGILDSLTYMISPEASKNTTTIHLKGQLLQITPQLNKTGVDTIIISAESLYGANKSDTFLVYVNKIQLVLQFPFNNYRFKLSEDQILGWGSVSSNQINGYVVKIVEIYSGQTPEQALNSNHLWFTDTIAPASGNTVTTKVALKFSVYGKMAWQVHAVNLHKRIVGESPVQVFYGSPLLESFYAGSNLVKVDTTIDHRLNSVSGTGSIDVPEKGAIRFDFRNLSLLSSGNIYYLKEGSVVLPFSDTISLRPTHSANGSGNLIIDSLYINKEGFALHSMASWKLPVAQSTWIDGLPGKISYNNFQLSGAIMLTGKSFLLDALPGAKMIIDSTSFLTVNGDNTFSPNMAGVISYRVSDRSAFINDSVVLAFRNVATINYFQGNSLSHASLGLNKLVSVTPVQYIVDLSKEKSPSNYDSPWEGIAVNRFKVSFNNRNLDYPLSLTSTDGVIFNSGKGSMFNISPEGIRLRIDTTFSISILSRFNGFAGSIKSIRFDRTGSNSSKDEITGGIVIPYIDENFEHSYVINFDEKDYLPEMKPRLTDFSFYPNSEKSIDEIHIVSGFQRYNGRVDQVNRLVYFAIPDTINIKAAPIYFIAKGSKVTIAESNIVRDYTLCDFTSPVVLRVYAGNGTYFDYVVTVLKNITGIEDPVNFVSVFPNPAQDFINIKGDNIEGSQVLIFDARGTLKLTQYIETSEATLSISTFIRGLYFIQIKKKDSVTNYRIIKE